MQPFKFPCPSENTMENTHKIRQTANEQDSNDFDWKWMCSSDFLQQVSWPTVRQISFVRCRTNEKMQAKC